MSKVAHLAARARAFWSRGPMLLQQLSLLDADALRSHVYDGFDFVHQIAEAAKLALADRLAWYGCSSAARPDVQAALLSDGYCADRLALVGVASKPGKGKASKAQFSDPEGNVWDGCGPRPALFRKALNAGRDINEFRVGRRTMPKAASKPEAVDATGSAASAAPSASASAPPAAKKAKRAAKVQCTGGPGHDWGGMGQRRGWLKAAIESGKSLADFAK